MTEGEKMSMEKRINEWLESFDFDEEHCSHNLIKYSLFSMAPRSLRMAFVRSSKLLLYRKAIYFIYFH